MSSILRTIELRLLRNHPHVWSWQLLRYVLAMLGMTVLAGVVARSIQISIDDMPDIGRTFVIWPLLALPLLVRWAIRFLRIDHPIQRKGEVKRALAICPIVFATCLAAGPTIMYVLTLEHRISAYFEEQFGPDAAAKVLEMSNGLDLQAASAAKQRSFELAMAIARDGFTQAELFPYNDKMFQDSVVFVLLLLGYLLYFGRHAPRFTFGVALAITLAVFLLAGLFSYVEEWVLTAPLVLSLVAIGFGGVVLAFPQRFGGETFVRELCLCVLPTFGLSFGLSAGPFGPDFDVDVPEQAVIVCAVVVLFSPPIYIGAERLRSRPV